VAYLGVLENERIATMGGALKLMQQSVLISSIRGPDTLAKYHVSKLKWSKRSPDQYHLSPIFTFGVEIIQGLSLMEIVKTVRLVVVPRAGVEPARPYGQRILSPFDGILSREIFLLASSCRIGDSICHRPRFRPECR
jgi:hypothetical protein